MADEDSYVTRRRPTATPDGLRGASSPRYSPYGEYPQTQTIRNNIADEGSYYSVVNPTIDTAVGFGAIAAYAQTTPFFLIANTAPIGGRTIFLDSLKMLCTVIPASATNWKFLIETDSTTRLSTAPTGGVSRTVLNTNPAMPNDFEGQVWQGTGGTVLTVMAAADGRKISQGRIAHAIPVALDELMIVFGEHDGGQTTSAAVVSRRVGYAAPCAIPPQCSAAIHMFGTSNAITGISFEYELNMWQR